MPVYGLPTALESSLNTLLNQRQPNSWRVSSHGEDITVVIRWPRNGLASFEKLVQCKSITDNSSGQETVSKHQRRHMWAKHSKSLKHSRKEMEHQRSTDSCSDSKSEMDVRRRQKERFSSSPSPLPSTPFPVYLTTSGQGTRTISYAYTDEKRRSISLNATSPQTSGDVFSKSQLHIKDGDKHASSPGRRSHASSTASSSSPSSFSSAFSSTSSPSSGAHDSKKSSRRRIKSEPSACWDKVAASTAADAIRSSNNAHNFYETIRRALKGYGHMKNESTSDIHLCVESPEQMPTSKSRNASESLMSNCKSTEEDDLFACDAERARKCEASVRSMHDSLTWDSIDGDDMEDTQ